MRLFKSKPSDTDRIVAALLTLANYVQTSATATTILAHYETILNRVREDKDK